MRGMLFAALLITLPLPGAWAQNFPNDDIDAASDRRSELSIDSRRKFIFADGRFDYDLAQVFDQFLKQHSLAEGGSAYTVVFNSGGGRLGPAMAIGRTIRKLRFNTVVGGPADNGADPVASGGCS